jgi:hypothetical protein
MTRYRFTRMSLGLALLLLMAAMPLRASTMGVSGGHDLDALWSRAQQRFDVSGNDAILLLESRHVTILHDGTVRTKTHRVVWIGTAMGIREQADLRIPYDTATSTLSVAALRTWRDGRWWPDAEKISGTAVVETLPFALATADDYTALRETMLLHDGVELPCIIETAYEIGEHGTAEGADGCWVFPQDNPAALVEFVLTVPGGTSPAVRSANGAPDPAVTTNADGSATYAWRMEDVRELGNPPVIDPASYAPSVSWSTWNGWDALDCEIASKVDDAATLSAALADTLAARLKNEPSQAAEARAIAGLVDEWTRFIHYDSRFWQFSPRPATRTWETAYGHAVDRAVLAIALFRAAGLAAEPVFRSAGSNGIDLDVPGLSRFDAMRVAVRADRFELFYDPGDGTLAGAARFTDGRTVWYPATGDAPLAQASSGKPEAGGRFELTMTIEPGEGGAWSGSGFLDADGLFSPYSGMAGLGREVLESLGKIAGSVLPNATVTGFNPEVFESHRVAASFELSLPAGERDDRGRIDLAMGDPAGGVMSLLPDDVHLYHERRTSPVYLPGALLERVTLRVKTAGREIAGLPEPRTVRNAIGEFVLTVSEDDGWVEIDRELRLAGGAVRPELWPFLRAILLEESDPQNGLILLK